MYNPDRNKCLSHNAEYKNKLTDDFFLLLAWISVFNSGHPHCKTCHSSDGNENNFRSAVQANSQSQYLHRIEVSRIFPSNLRKTNRFFIKDGLLCSDFFPGKNFKHRKYESGVRLQSSLYCPRMCNRRWIVVKHYHYRYIAEIISQFFTGIMSGTNPVARFMSNKL